MKCPTIFVLSCSATLLYSAEDNDRQRETQQTPEAKVATEPRLSKEDLHALELGRKVIRVKAALQAPGEQTSIEAVKELGLDTRYYVLVRGWIVQHISMAESYKGTSVYQKSNEKRQEIDDRITVLKRMLRTIDLE